MTLLIATDPCDPPITNTKGASAGKPNRTFAARRAALQSGCESLNAFATSERKGSPANSACSNFPESTGCATARCCENTAPKRFAQPGFAFAS